MNSASGSRQPIQCGSGTGSAVLRIRTPDPDICPSRIPDLGSRIQKQQQKRGVKKFCCHTGTFLCSHKFHKIENYISFEVQKKKILANFHRIIELFTQKLSLCSQKNGFGIQDPGFEIRDPEKTYSGSGIPGSKRHRVPDAQHCGSETKMSTHL